MVERAMTHFFRLRDDITRADRWYLNGPVTLDGQELDPREFTYSRRVDVASVRIEVREPGEPLDFTLADFDMPVLLGRYTDELQELASGDFQRIRAQVDDRLEPFDILNVLPLVSCLDHENSELTYWTESDENPEMVGQVRMVVTLRIRSELVGNHHLFRIREWPVPIIISQQARAILQQAQGAVFTRV
jgi:hypothetical protein